MTLRTLFVTSSILWWTATAKLHGEKTTIDRELLESMTSVSSSDEIPVSASGEEGWSPKPYILDLEARFVNERNLVGRVAVKQTEETQGLWAVRIDKYVNMCGEGFTGELTWHIHAKAAEEGNEILCDLGQTSGHWDPDFACGPATQWPTELCDIIKRALFPPEYVYSDVCSTDTPSGCEIGDLSGKSGRVSTYKLGEVQWFEDYWLGNIDDIAGLSIVFHCCVRDGDGERCSSRIACANLNPFPLY